MTWGIVPDSDIITQGYGCTSFQSEWIDPNCPSGRRHTGIDFGHTGGGQLLFRKPVIAPRAGTIQAVGANGAGDQWFSHYLGPQAVCLHMEDGRYLLLAHLDEAKVNVGQHVTAGTVLGLVGTKGNSTAPHLHVEVRTDGAFQTPFNTLDPTPYLQVQKPGGEQEMMTDSERKELIARNWVNFYGEWPPPSGARSGESPEQYAARMKTEPDFEHTWVVVAPDRTNIFEITMAMYNDPRAVAYRQRLASVKASPPPTTGGVVAPFTAKIIPQ